MGDLQSCLRDSHRNKNLILDFLVPRERIELSTQGFSVLCSTTELPRPIFFC